MTYRGVGNGEGARRTSCMGARFLLVGAVGVRSVFSFFVCVCLSFVRARKHKYKHVPSLASLISQLFVRNWSLGELVTRVGELVTRGEQVGTTYRR